MQAPGGAPLTGVQAPAIGGSHTCAATVGGETRCWGQRKQTPAVYRQHLEAAGTVDCFDRDAAIAHLVEKARLVAGTARPLREGDVRAFVARDTDRSGGHPAGPNFDWRGAER